MAAPDYNVVLTPKKESEDGKRRYTRVGAAWQSTEGKKGISIHLNPGVTLDWRMMDDFYLTLYPTEDQTKKMVWDEKLQRRVPIEDSTPQHTGERYRRAENDPPPFE